VPKKKHYKGVDGICRQCEFGCDSCSSSDVCEKCDVNTVLLNGLCWNECPAGTFANSLRQCIQCSEVLPMCDKCTAKDACQVCAQGFLLQQGNCVEKCLKDFIAKDGECVTCKNGSCLEQPNVHIPRSVRSARSVKNFFAEILNKDTHSKGAVSWMPMLGVIVVALVIVSGLLIYVRWKRKLDCTAET